MTTGNMPNPPDQPTTQVVPAATAADAGDPVAVENAALPLSLAEDMARIIEEQADVIAQKQYYHSQLMLGVSALGTDIVSARQSALMVARAIRNSDTAVSTHTLVNLGDAQFAQVNDRTLPYRFNSQIAGLLQGIIAEVITQSYRAEPDKLREANMLLSSLFDGANRDVMALPKEPPRFQSSRDES